MAYAISDTPAIHPTPVAEHGRRTRGEAHRDAELAELRNKLKAKAAECAELHRKLDAATTVIAAFHHDNQALLEHLDSRTGKLTDLTPAGRRPAAAQSSVLAEPARSAARA
ncbi:hypothetical protein ACSNOI_41140, partial [Actinomadura kijaniata]|uniref:hypothetical protein n=1 Tax=Actinomadura kijaniata TaxID=46161 RepID=UPI003F1BA4D8